MISASKMKLQWVIGLYLLHIGLGQLMEPGSCSQKCQDRSDQDKATVEENTVSVSQTYCSCTPSCKVYEDCCYDSPFRAKERSTPVQMSCISLSNKGSYRAIARCSNNWNESSIFCRESIGHLPPVTSQVTGITYANTHCAVCNEDAEQLVTWKVTVRCCPEHDDLDDPSKRFFINDVNGYLYSVLFRKIDDIPRRCSCKYFAHHQDNSFIDSLEIRICEKSNYEIAKCSSTWSEESIKNKCDSFLEPVYIGGEVYRNLYCAWCNHAKLNQLYCNPVIVNKKLSENANHFAIYNDKKQNDFQENLHIFGFFGKGKTYAYSDLMKVNRKFPERKRLCNYGERYDPLSKMCKKLE